MFLSLQASECFFPRLQLLYILENALLVIAFTIPALIDTYFLAIRLESWLPLSRLSCLRAWRS